MIACDYGLKCRQLNWDLQTFPVEVSAVQISGLKSRDILVFSVYIPPSLVKDSLQPLSNVLEFVEQYKASTALSSLVFITLPKPAKCNDISSVFVFGLLPSPAHFWRDVRFIAPFVTSASVGELFYPL